MLAVDENEIRKFAADAPIIRDDRNFFATHSPWLEVQAARDSSAAALGAHDTLAKRAADLDLDVEYLARRLIASGRISRLLASQVDPTMRVLLRAEAAANQGESQRAIRGFRRALEMEPELPLARLRLLQAKQRAGAKPDPSLVDGADTAIRTVLEGWRLRVSGQWSELSELDGEFAAIDVRHPASRPAHQLRLAWRLEDGRTKTAREGLALLDGLGGVYGARAHAMRALLAARAGDEAAARSSLRSISTAIETRGKNRTGIGPHARSLAIRALEELPSHPEWSRLREALTTPATPRTED